MRFLGTRAAVLVRLPRGVFVGLSTSPKLDPSALLWALYRENVPGSEGHVPQPGPQGGCSAASPLLPPSLACAASSSLAFG